MIDLTEAIEAAARALADIGEGEDWPTNYVLGGNPTGTRDDEYRDAMLDDASDALTAAFPLIEAQVRVQIAAELLAEARPHDSKGFSAVGDAYAHAARIARGMSKTP